MSIHTPNIASADEIERLIYYMPTVARLAENEWAKGFALSVTKQSRRKGWKPSAKQLSVMRELVSDLFVSGGDQEGDIQLFE